MLCRHLNRVLNDLSSMLKTMLKGQGTITDMERSNVQ